MSTISFFSLQTLNKTSPFHPSSSPYNSVSCGIKNHSFASIRKGIPRKAKSFNGGAVFAVACSTSSPFIGKVGWYKREGNFSLLSFGVDPKSFVEAEVKSDASQFLSALLPFVVALTAVAALYEPSTFTWTLRFYSSILVNGEDTNRSQRPINRWKPFI